MSVLSAVKAALALPLPGYPSSVFSAMRSTELETRRYPEWRSRLKMRGRRDRSLCERSNRRKAAAKARAR